MSAMKAGALRAALSGVAAVARAPGLLLAILILTMLSALPFVFTVQSAVGESLALQPGATAVGGSEIDPEWWLEFRRHAGGLAATFTPAILGFAAPLDSVSALLDGRRPPLALVFPVAVAALLWVLLWGGVINRFATGRTSLREFISSGISHFVPLLIITVCAAAVSVALYVTAHSLLFGLIYGAAAPRMPSEPAAFALRVILYAGFGVLLVAANAVFAFARIEVVANGHSSPLQAIGRAVAFVRARAGSVLGLYAIFVAALAVALIMYGAGEVYGGSRVGGWRAVAIGQAFIALRLALRLSLAAAQVRFAGAQREPAAGAL